MPPVPQPREQPDEVPWREVEHDERDDDPDGWTLRSYPIGSARTDIFWPEPTDEQRQRWAEEDAERERRRIPLGFRDDTKS